MASSYFDLAEYQQKALEITSAKKLFELWDEVCRFYDRGLTGRQELSTMKTLVLTRLYRLDLLKAAVDNVRS